MGIIAMAEEHPELFGDRVVGVALIATTAGGLSPHRILVPAVPSGLGSALALRAVAVLSRGHRAVDGVRRIGRAVASVATDAFAFGDDVPASYVEFVDSMLSATPFEVIAEFFPNFTALDKFETVQALAHVPVSIICGTEDKLTSIGHSRKLHATVPGSRLLELEGAGHMVILERHEEVNAELDQLFAASRQRKGRR
jgi:pimeloyl-ACP methyl ester carboxylesterase